MSEPTTVWPQYISGNIYASLNDAKYALHYHIVFFFLFTSPYRIAIFIAGWEKQKKH